MDSGKDLVICMTFAGLIGWIIYSYIKNPKEALEVTFSCIYYTQWLILFFVMVTSIQHGIFHDYSNFSKSDEYDEGNDRSIILTLGFFGLLWFINKRLKALEADRLERLRIERKDRGW